MRLDLYQAETARIAAEQQSILNAARAIIASGKQLTPLEQSGLLHALQIIIENAIGKAKHWLKAKNQTVPVSAYDAFQALADIHAISQQNLPEWNAVIELRNRIVHDYMNIDFDQVIDMLRGERERFVIEFLLQELPGDSTARSKPSETALVP